MNDSHLLFIILLTNRGPPGTQSYALLYLGGTLHCPKSFRPQQTTFPASVITAVWSRPQVITSSCLNSSSNCILSVYKHSNTKIIRELITRGILLISQRVVCVSNIVNTTAMDIIITAKNAFQNPLQSESTNKQR
jgi:hypothetical protein